MDARTCQYYTDFSRLWMLPYCGTITFKVDNKALDSTQDPALITKQTLTVLYNTLHVYLVSYKCALTFEKMLWFNGCKMRVTGSQCTMGLTYVSIWFLACMWLVDVQRVIHISILITMQLCITYILLLQVVVGHVSAHSVPKIKHSMLMHN